MNLVAGGLGAAITASGVSGLAAVVLPPRARAGVVGIGTAAAGVAGAVAGVAALSGQVWRSALPGLLPLAGVSIEVDALSGWFLLIVGGLSALYVPDRIETYLYTPLLAAGRRLGRAARTLANGSVHRYLAYGLITLLIVLVAGVSR